jgi:hypothetical protein
MNFLNLDYVHKLDTEGFEGEQAMVAAVMTATLVLQMAQAHPAPSEIPMWTTRPQDVIVLLTAPRTTYVAGEDVRIHVRVVNSSSQALRVVIRVPDWLIFGITIKNGYAGELQPNVQREMTNGGAEVIELPPHGSHDYSAVTGTTLRHWGYALTTPGSYAIRVFSESPNKTRIYSNTISIKVVSGSY